MVAYQTVGTSIHQPMGVVALAWHHLKVVLPSPVQADDDVAPWVIASQLDYLLA